MCPKALSVVVIISIVILPRTVVLLFVIVLIKVVVIAIEFVGETERKKAFKLTKNPQKIDVF